MIKNDRLTLFRLTCVAMVVAFGMLMPACGGGGSGGGGGGVTNPLTASFAPSNANPGANTINMDGATTGANVSVLIQVTDVDDFSGAGFRVTYDPDTVDFVGFNSTGSLLENHGSATYYDADEPVEGTVIVVASVQDASQPAGMDVVGTQTLITLNFQATTTTNGNTLSFTSPRDVRVCPTQGQQCPEVSNQLVWAGGTITASR